MGLDSIPRPAPPKTAIDIIQEIGSNTLRQDDKRENVLRKCHGIKITNI